MPRERSAPSRDAAWLLDMLDAAKAVSSFVAGRTFEQFKSDLLFRSGVHYQVQIIGEAACAVSDTFKEKFSQIPWRPIMAQRHRLVHEYGDIDLDIIWRVATVHVPALIKELTPLIPPPPTR